MKDNTSPCVETRELKDYLILLEEREKFLVNQLCGDKYNREKHHFTRCKTQRKTIFTRFGKITYKFMYVKDKRGVIFSPLLKWLEIPKYQRLSEDFKRVLADKPSKMTYRKSAEDVRNSFNISISAMTLHKYVKETASSLNIAEDPDPTHKVLLADGTKVNGPNLKHEPKVVISIGDTAQEKVLLAHAVNKSWREIARSLDLKQYDVFVGDGERGLAQAFCADGKKFHFCHEHAKRDLAHYLWKDGLTKKQYDPYCEEFKGILHCLQNSTKKYKLDQDWDRLLKRIQSTWKEINTLATKLSCRELHESAAFLLRNKKHLTTAAEVAIQGIVVPWTTNSIERVMQEMGIRTKKKGMYWSEEGLDRILRIVLKRYFLPQERRYYKEIFATLQKEAVKS